MEYLVTWHIEIEAESHEDAARKALAIQRDPESTATVFGVAGPGEEEDSFIIDAGDAVEMAKLETSMKGTDT